MTRAGVPVGPLALRDAGAPSRPPESREAAPSCRPPLWQTRGEKQFEPFTSFWVCLSAASDRIAGMTHTTPSARARDALNAARSAHYALRDAYADPTHPPRPGTAAALHTEVKYGLKVAEVEALLEVAAQVAAVRATILEAAPSRAEFAARVRVVGDTDGLRTAPAHHPSCPVHHNAAGECVGCLEGPRVPRPASVAEVTRRVAAARQQ